MKKLSLILITILLLVGCQKQQALENMSGYYEGAIDVMGKELLLTLTLDHGETLEGFVDIEMQGVYGLDIIDVLIEDDGVTFSINAGGNIGTFSGVYAESVYAGDFTQNGQSFPFELKKAEKIVHNIRETVQLEVDGVSLHGELILPLSDEPVPVALIIAGSGPTDLNGNSPAGVSTNSYLYLAKALEENGIASLRYNKRSIGNTIVETELSFDDFVNDAVLLLEQLKSDARFSEVYVIGHSQGALIAELAAQKVELNKVVLLAGAGHSIDEVMMDQLTTQLDDVTLSAAEVVFGKLSNGETTSDVPEVLISLFKESIQPFLISWIKYDPVAILNELDEEVLVVVGSEDLQVPISEGEVFLTSDKEITYVVIEGMNHVLKYTSSDREENIRTYQNIDLPIHEGLINELINFLVQ